MLFWPAYMIPEYNNSTYIVINISGKEQVGGLFFNNIKLD